MSDELLPPSIETAELTWQDGVPESSRFGDVYFNREDGLAESRHVFLRPNRLSERFESVPARGSFVVAESGFGTGLNFLATWQAWRERATNPTAILHFVSVERFPLQREDLVRALALWPELTPLAAELADKYPPLTRGAHRILLDGGRVRLTLYLGDIQEAWQALQFKADAWFLDGFSPARNPEMWLDQALAMIRAHSKPGATLATFTSVSRVRRTLESAGFTMQVIPGFGRKRDMLAGTLPVEVELNQDQAPPSVAIIGAGIAGCLLARNLAERGIPVTLIDSATGPGAGASGNRQGATYVKLGVEFNDQTELALTALCFSQRFYARFRDQYWHPTGLLQLAWSEQEQDRQRRFLNRNAYPVEVFYPVDQHQAGQLTGVPTQTGGLWFPGSGWLEPAKLCTELAAHPLIRQHFQTDVRQLQRLNSTWAIKPATGPDMITDRVVICAGHLTPALLPVSGRFRLKKIRGQVTHLESQTLTSPRSVICGPRYLNPVQDGVAVVGATFDLRDDNPDPTVVSHEQNLKELTDLLPGILRDAEGLGESVEGRVSFRCATHDYQPVADELCDSRGQVSQNLFMFTGLGSKGLTYAPLLAEYLADRLSGQPQCLPARLMRRLASQRLHQAEKSETNSG